MSVFHINIRVKTRLNPTKIPIIQRKQPLLSKRDVPFLVSTLQKPVYPQTAPSFNKSNKSMNSKVQRKWAYWHYKRSHHPPNTRNHQNLTPSSRGNFLQVEGPQGPPSHGSFMDPNGWSVGSTSLKKRLWLMTIRKYQVDLGGILFLLNKTCVL